MKIYAVRHGESESNRDRRFSGWSQVHLTEAGRRDAQRAGELLAGLRFDRVYASDLQRAMETAHIALPGCEPEQRAQLRENDVGAFQDRLVTECREAYGELCDRCVQARDFTPVGGENRAMMYARVAAFMREMETADARHVAVFCHEGTIKRMLDFVLGQDVAPRAIWLANGSVTVFSFGTRWRLDAFNLTQDIWRQEVLK